MADEVRIMCGHCGNREARYSIRDMVTKMVIPVCLQCLEKKLPIILETIG